METARQDSSITNSEREILEALDRIVRSEHGATSEETFIPCEFVRSQTSFGIAAHLGDEFLRRLRIMEHKGMVRVAAISGTGCKGCVVTLAPGGMERLLMSEEEFQVRNQPAIVNQFSNTFQGSVGQLAQTFGTHSPVVQHQRGIDPDQILPLVDRLLADIKNHSQIPPDAYIEAEQLKGELRKSHPRLNWIAEHLDALKILAGAVGSVTGIIEEIRKLLGLH
jgi:hypothetical protein